MNISKLFDIKVDNRIDDDKMILLHRDAQNHYRFAGSLVNIGPKERKFRAVAPPKELIHNLIHRRTPQVVLRFPIDKFAMFGKILKFEKVTDSKSQFDWRFQDKDGFWHDITHEHLLNNLCPYGVKDDGLWCKEPWKITLGLGYGYNVQYLIDHKTEYFANLKISPKQLFKDSHPAINMSKEISRFNLQIINISIEQVQDINAYTMVQEGMWCPQLENKVLKLDACKYKSILTQQYKDFWNDRYKKYHSWELNAWTWRIECAIIQ